jgi:autoinducer 2-degrading protein
MIVGVGPVLVVIVRFAIAPEMIERFVGLVTDNARLSRLLEPGCQRFDVLRPADGSSQIVLYELYASTEDFDDHLARPHFIAFDTATRSMVIEKRVERFEMVDPALSQR